ncbi:Nitrilase family, member 2 [Seminavis robusta]|uniref:Nitrilase family, member 2 n=1 Tax=Seminavis robusta TaxID=568900 RepID=A0A9N8ENB5_9STRA|nr:Nitrilase family, member 2 [Seminavis robusta]|eukprot:Sro1272_g258240.1 Nitrilase family, member 2 (209) ;mRNA; f:19746-20372
MMMISTSPSASMALINVLAEASKATNGGSDFKPLPTSFKPGPNDVICARGKARHHVGNVRFMTVVESHYPKYANAKNRVEKSLIVSEIVDQIRDDSPLGGFVRPEGGRWYLATDATAREKFGQRLRDLVGSGKYASSSKAKRSKRRAHEAILASKVGDVVASQQGTSLADRVKQLVAERNVHRNDDAQMQSIFNQANVELLQRLNRNA